MKNKIIKKIIVLFSLSFVLFSFNFAKAEDAPVLKENFIIKNSGSVIWQGEVNLPSPGNVVISGQNVNSQSVLAVLTSIDTSTENFSISDLSYDNTYHSFLLNCITPSGASPLCYNWQYVVNGSYPPVGMDKTVLSGSETVYVYFGPQNKISLNKNSITNEEELTVTALKYNFENDSWGPRSGVTVGVTKPTDIPFSPNDDIKSQVEASTGLARFSAIPAGEYDVGIKEDYYWPTEKLIVTKAIHESHGSSGSYIANFIKTIIVPKTFSTENALKFLEKNQKVDGSFGDSLYTDWAAIAVATGESKEVKEKLIKYYKENNLESNLVTDNERRAMALMALGINPYTDTKVNYIEKIVGSFDGTQFGDNKIENDDIFALVVLKNAGYDDKDEIISKDINYLISKESKDGSWGSIDMTAAYIQALRGLENIAGVNDSILKSENYITVNQKSDGGFENLSSTAWVLQSLYNNEKILKAEKYLIDKQEIDGGLESIDTNINTRIWATSYAIPAVLHKYWGEILQKFPKQEFIISPIIKDEVVNKNLKAKKTELSKDIEQDTNKNNLDLIQQDIVKKVSFPSKLNTFWSKTKYSFKWLFNKLSF